MKSSVREKSTLRAANRNGKGSKDVRISILALDR